MKKFLAKRLLTAGLLMVRAIASPSPLAAIETKKVELREGSNYDGAVLITRTSGELVFKDTPNSDTVTLSELRNAAGDHGALTGLADDDHPQYLNAARHGASHSAGFNDDLAITPDHAGNLTLGGHVGDADIHLSRDGNEAIDGAWTFNAPVVFDGGQITLSDPDTSALTKIVFEQSPEVSLTYVPSLEMLNFTRLLSASELSVESGTMGTLALQDTLDGRVDGVRTGTLTGFSSIEGIDAADLLGRGRNEDITGAWDFLAPAQVSTSDSALDAQRQSMTVTYSPTIAPTAATSDRRRSGLRVTADLDAPSSVTLDDTQLHGVFAHASVDNTTTSSVSGSAIGVLGSADTQANTLAAVGVAGIGETSASGSRRVGVLGAMDDAALDAPTQLPAGNHAGVFLGDVFVSQVLSAEALAIRAVNGSGAAIDKGDVLAWNSSGEVVVAVSGASSAAPFAGVALDDADDGVELRVAIVGVADVKSTATITAGSSVTWSGSGLAQATGSDKARLGVALEGYAGGSETFVRTQLVPTLVP